MKKLLLLSCMGFVAFSSESFGARTKSGVPIDEKLSPQKKKNASGKNNYRKIQRQENFIFPKKKETSQSEEKENYNTKKTLIFLNFTNEENKKPKSILKNHLSKEVLPEQIPCKTKKRVHFLQDMPTTSEEFKKNVNVELLIQKGRGQDSSHQTLQVKFSDVESNKSQPKKRIASKPKKLHHSSENEENVPPLLLTRGDTFYIPNEENQLKTVFKPLESNKPQSILKKKEQK